MKTERTLQQGLDRFQERNAKYFSDKPISEEAKRFLRSHDIAHVVFGCNTTLYGEGVVKVWTAFGTDQSFWAVTKGYRAASAFSLSREFSFQHVVKSIGRFLLAIPKTISRARQMTKPWVWSDYEPYLNKPLAEVREEFGIRVVE
ncbi:MAG: Coq4 family protein [Saprospiraceae bacterium]